MLGSSAASQERMQQHQRVLVRLSTTSIITTIDQQQCQQHSSTILQQPYQPPQQHHNYLGWTSSRQHRTSTSSHWKKEFRIRRSQRTLRDIVAAHQPRSGAKSISNIEARQTTTTTTQGSIYIFQLSIKHLPRQSSTTTPRHPNDRVQQPRCTTTSSARSSAPSPPRSTPTSGL